MNLSFQQPFRIKVDANDNVSTLGKVLIVSRVRFSQSVFMLQVCLCVWTVST